MNKRRATILSLFAVVLLLLALTPMFSHEPRAVAQSEGGSLGACVLQQGVTGWSTWLEQASQRCIIQLNPRKRADAEYMMLLHTGSQQLSADIAE